MAVESRVGRPRRAGLRRQWRTALIMMLAALGLAGAGTTVAYVQVVGHYRAAADQLHSALALSADLTTAVVSHEALAHALWNGAPVDRTRYLAQQAQIGVLFDKALRDLHGAGQRDLIADASRQWRLVLVSRNLWGPAAAARPGVTLSMQAQFGADSDEVADVLGQLSGVAITDGSHDLAVADSLQRVVVALLLGMLALVVVVTLYFARRMTTDVIRPVELLQRAAVLLREGDLTHRVEVPARSRSNELGDLAGAFNEMADALDESHRDLNRQAMHDSLTGLPNRAAFQRRLDGQLGERRASNGACQVSVLFLDIDDFKVVNDSLGHAAGDAVLVGVAERLVTCVRPADVVARLGGDEFAVLVTEDTPDLASATLVAGRIEQALRAPFVIAGERVLVAVSIGISASHPDAQDVAELLAQADFAMYTAKRQGKGRSEIFDATATMV